MVTHPSSCNSHDMVSIISTKAGKERAYNITRATSGTFPPIQSNVCFETQDPGLNQHLWAYCTRNPALGTC